MLNYKNKFEKKMPPFKSLLLKRVSPSYKGKEYLQTHKIFNRNTDFSFKGFFWKLEEQFLTDDPECLLIRKK